MKINSLKRLIRLPITSNSTYYVKVTPITYRNLASTTSNKDKFYQQ